MEDAIKSMAAGIMKQSVCLRNLKQTFVSCRAGCGVLSCLLTNSTTANTARLRNSPMNMKRTSMYGWLNDSPSQVGHVGRTCDMIVCWSTQQADEESRDSATNTQISGMLLCAKGPSIL
ncbi:hypothetical protein SS50377_21406 [Spironucleus salmonicida]|uniref:Uncharacterized protein n=1 Tax=Spironucleus salmonicida TaxID=348837 RepID=A0A9P8LXR8_9EUKA|nr:hypothetical protein SS50377_21406 [Spironucleus salmonicida]